MLGQTDEARATCTSEQSRSEHSTPTSLLQRTNRSLRQRRRESSRRLVDGRAECLTKQGLYDGADGGVTLPAAGRANGRLVMVKGAEKIAR